MGEVGLGCFYCFYPTCQKECGTERGCGFELDGDNLQKKTIIRLRTNVSMLPPPLVSRTSWLGTMCLELEEGRVSC